MYTTQKEYINGCHCRLGWKGYMFSCIPKHANPVAKVIIQILIHFGYANKVG